MTTVRLITDQLERGVERLIIRLSLGIVARLQSQPGDGGTPIDTGWARANWAPSIGAPNLGPAPRPPDGGASVGPQAAASAAGVAELAATYRLRRGPVFISNHVPYIERLNAGHSRQAPPGFVQAAIVREVRALADRVVR